MRLIHNRRVCELTVIARSKAGKGLKMAKRIKFCRQIVALNVLKIKVSRLLLTAISDHNR